MSRLVFRHHKSVPGRLTAQGETSTYRIQQVNELGVTVYIVEDVTTGTTLQPAHGSSTLMEAKLRAQAYEDSIYPPIDRTPVLVHHMAYRLAETLAICGAGSAGEVALSLTPEAITCPECRSICSLGPITQETPT